MTRALIGLGSNLADPHHGDSIDLLCFARDALAQTPGLRVTAVSPLYRSAPIGPADQPDFFNAVLALDSELDAPALLAHLLQLEQQAGRVRRRHWGERTLDLDLLLYGDQIIKLPDLIVPHPRLQERAFVLLPLLDILPEARLPGGMPLQHYCAAARDQPICRHQDPRWSATRE